MADQRTEATIAIEAGGRRCFIQDLGLRVGLDHTLLEARDVAEMGTQVRNSVGVDSHQVGGHEYLGPQLRALWTKTLSLENRLRKAPQRFLGYAMEVGAVRFARRRCLCDLLRHALLLPMTSPALSGRV